MPIAQAPSATPTFPNTISPPVNLDPLDATQLNTDVETPLQNGTEASRLLTYGGGFFPRVVALSNTNMTIQPLGAVVVLVAGTWTVVRHLVASTIDPLALAGGAFAANTRYYVYANVVAGIIVWSVSTTAPDAGLRYKTGDEQYQFISTFYTNNAANLLLYTQSDHDYSYDNMSAQGAGVHGNIVLDGGIALVPTLFTTVGGAVPANAMQYRVRARALATAGNAYSFYGVFAATPADYTLFPINSGVIPAVGVSIWSGTQTSLAYYVDAITTNLSVWITGFRC